MLQPENEQITEQPINQTSQKGSKMVLMIILIAAILLMGGGILLYKTKQPSTVSLPNQVNQTENSQYPGTTPVVNQPQTAQSGTVLAGDTSDIAVDKDLQTVGNNMQNLDNSTQSVDEGMSQQQVDPTQ